MAYDAETDARNVPSGRRRRRGPLLLLAATVLVLSLAATSCVSADQTTVFNQVNNSRTTRGWRAMSMNQWMADFAQNWAERMAATCTLRHSANYATANPYPWRRLAENVGSGPSLASAHRAFLNSPSHKANIVDPDFNYLGTGVAKGCGHYWVVHEFMQY